MRTVSIIGVGRIGGALAFALDENYRIENLISRSLEKPDKIAEKLNSRPQTLLFDQARKINSEIILICTPDAEIQNVAATLVSKITHKPYVYHTSGALSSKILDDLKKVGCPIGSIHPLVSASEPNLGSKRFKGAYFGVEGESSAVRLAEKIVEDLGGKPFTIASEYKTLYHAAAVTACGHLIAVIDAALEMLGECGLENEDARRILLPLIRSTVENLETQTTETALTGTFARADFSTFEKQIRALEKNVSAEALEIYLLLGARSLKLAEKQGAKRENVEKIQKRILLAKKKIKC